MAGGFGDTEIRGTVTLTNGETGVVLNDVVWDDEMAGDVLYPIIPNSCAMVLATDVIDPFASALLKAPWPGTTGTYSYVLVKLAGQRIDVNIPYAAGVREFLAAIRRAGFIWSVEAGAEPDAGVGEDGAWAIRFDDFTWWNKIDGAWILKGSVDNLDVSTAIAAAANASISAANALASEQAAALSEANTITARVDTIAAKNTSIAQQLIASGAATLAQEWADKEPGLEVTGNPGRFSSRMWASQTLANSHQVLTYLIAIGLLSVADMGLDAPAGSNFDMGQDATLVTISQYDWGQEATPSISPFIKTLLDDPNAATAQTTLGMLVDIDATLAANSDTRVASQKAVRTYVAAYLAAQDVEVFKGFINCSTNPNYPAADAGHVYRVSAAGKIGGASGVNVELNDRLECVVDGTAAGTQAAVGANWMISQVNIDGAVVGPASAADGTPMVADGPSGKLIKNVSFATFKTGLVLVKGDVGLGNVDNTSDLTKRLGTTTNDNALAGYIGEYIRSSTADKAGNAQLGATVTISIASPAIVSWTAHPFVGIAVVNFTTTGALPTPLAVGTNYYAVAPVDVNGLPVDSNNFKLATSVANAIAGTYINTSGTQSGVHTAVPTAILATGAPVDIAGFLLPAGDFDVSFDGVFFIASTTSITLTAANVGPTSSTVAGSIPGRLAQTSVPASVPGISNNTMHVGPARFSQAAPINVYASVQCNFTVNTVAGWGGMRARRIR